jgi:hypothetical protein
MKKFLHRIAVFLIPVLFLLAIPIIFLIYSRESFSRIYNIVKSGDKYLIGYAYDESNYKFLKWAEINNRPQQEVIALGSSRVLLFRERMFTSSYYGCGSMISSISDFLPFLKSFPEEKFPKYLIIGLDQWMFNAQWDALKDKKKQYIEWEKLYTDNISIVTLKNTWKDILKGKYGINIFYQDMEDHSEVLVGLNAFLNRKGFTKDGSFYYGNQLKYLLEGSPLADDYQFENTFSRIEQGNQRFEYGDKVNPKAVNELEKILSYLRERDVSVVAILPPFADAVNKKMAETGKYHYQEAIFPTLKPIFDKYGFELWDTSHFSTYDSNDKEAIDGFHGGEVSYLRLLIYILEKGSILNNVTDISTLKDDFNNRKNSLSVY